MANTKDQYLTRIETSPGRVKRLQRDGWEITATDRHLLTPNEFHLRKLNPDYIDPETRRQNKLAGSAEQERMLRELAEARRKKRAEKRAARAEIKKAKQEARETAQAEKARQKAEKQSNS